MIKFKVIYLQPKNKKNHYSQQEAIFYNESDAVKWQNHVKSQQCKDVEIVPVF